MIQRDLEDDIDRALSDADAGNFDIKGIVHDLDEKYDLLGPDSTITLADIDDDAFWDVVLRHDLDNNEGEQS